MKKLILSILFAFFATAIFAQVEIGTVLTGKCSYYGSHYATGHTASGEDFHRDSMTCAHLTLPFGTVLRVRNIDNDKEVVVRVTDRGPYVKKYSLDISMGAAEKLNIIRKGWANYEATVIGFSPINKSPKSHHSHSKKSSHSKKHSSTKHESSKSKHDSSKSKKHSSKSSKHSSKKKK